MSILQPNCISDCKVSKKYPNHQKFLPFLQLFLKKTTKNALFFEQKDANVCKFQKKVVTLHRFSVKPYRKAPLARVLCFTTTSKEQRNCVC